MSKLFGLNAGVMNEISQFMSNGELSVFPEMNAHFRDSATPQTTAIQIDMGLHFGRN